MDSTNAKDWRNSKIEVEKKIGKTTAASRNTRMRHARMIVPASIASSRQIYHDANNDPCDDKYHKEDAQLFP